MYTQKPETWKKNLFFYNICSFLIQFWNWHFDLEYLHIRDRCNFSNTSSSCSVSSLSLKHFFAECFEDAEESGRDDEREQMVLYFSKWFWLWFGNDWCQLRDRIWRCNHSFSHPPTNTLAHAHAHTHRHTHNATLQSMGSHRRNLSEG